MMRQLIVTTACMLALTANAQDDNKLTLSGSVQSDMLVPQGDSKIGATKDEDFLTNTYVDLLLQHKDFDAGLRMEYLDHPLPGFENEFKGWGVPHFYVKGRLSWAELTVGTFYEQFGSGFILRSYEERSLGIDNSLLGGKLVVKPAKGVTVKALTGRQRTYWDWTKSHVSGADAEVNIDEWIPALQNSDTRVMVGASWVNKNEKKEDIFADATHKVNMPRNVNAWDVRAQLNHGNWGLLAEYAQKGEDPSFDNGYTFHRGSAAMLSLSYSKKGMSVLLQAKRSEDMAFRSERSRTGMAAMINHLPAFTQDHTYALAILYPYATQLADGEWAYQAELGYNFKRNTPLGGKYGTDVKFNFSYVREIDHSRVAGNTMGTKGYDSKFFKWGDRTFYHDLNVQLSKRINKAFKLNLMYMNQHYNQAVVEGHGEMIKSNIFIADAKYQFSPKTTLRGELQYLTTKQDEGDWVFGLLELSLVPHWMITVSDQWNCGTSKVHYYQGLVTYNIGAHRIQAGYSRVREGYNCSGGVCRWIPARKGFTMSYNYNF